MDFDNCKYLASIANENTMVCGLARTIERDINFAYDAIKDADFIYNLNVEACNEAFRQIRMRNLSGMILIDFINMKSELDNKTLFELKTNFKFSDKYLCYCIERNRLNNNVVKNFIKFLK